MKYEEKNLGQAKSEAALREEKILEFWKQNKIFEKSLAKKSPKGEFVFYEGPPTANAKPALHHLEARAFKDAVPRYKTMRGFHVRRKGGWDTHGLPVELQVEKKLGLNSKKAIEEYGVAKFNRECRESVFEYVDFWNKFTERIGYWVDEEHPYITYSNQFIESVWHILKRVNSRGLLYKDYKVVPWCPRCGTALSSHELAQGYQGDKDLSVTVKFLAKGGFASGGKVVIEPNTYILAWTTTPWTLPGNLALAVGAEIDYVKVLVGNGQYILAKDRLSILDGSYEIIEEFKGEKLVGLGYEPLYNFYARSISSEEKTKLEKAFQVYAADFVNTEDGTGIVHTAVMYGQDDFALGNKLGLPKYHLVDEEGRFINSMDFLSGKFVKDEETAVLIIKDLAARGLLSKKEKYQHSYPHCWRCKTALIYYARDSWYIKMSDPKIKKELVQENKNINWEPAHIREGRFGEWLREIKDWAISRERYWGTPLPIWQCASCGRREVLGSIADLREHSRKSGNRYFVMRHGESQSNIAYGAHGVVSSRASNSDPLTAKGRREVTTAARRLKKGKKIDLVFASPFVRTRETVKILQEVLGLKDTQIIFDERLAELDAGDFEGKAWDEYRRMFKNERERFLNPIHGGESLLDLKRRIGGFIYEIEKRYAGKNILIVSHGAPLWMLFAVSSGYDVDESISMTGGVFRHSEKLERALLPKFKHFQNAECRALDFVPLSRNVDYELDLHRPYIDELEVLCECGGSLFRTREVLDVWFDSGAMPFAQDHYPFEAKKWVDGRGYPADYIAEAIDQTRGWFYTLHAVGILMSRGKAYKNVVCLGHLLDADGKKMSKSIGNIVDPWQMMDKYGADTVRLWMYSVNQPGESKNFDEKTLLLLRQQVFTLLYNVLAFYELYRDPSLEKSARLNSKNVLDIWILSRLDELIKLSTENLDKYKLLEPVRGIKDFIGDLSTWYLRRSRERIKAGDRDAKKTLYFVLRTLCKLLAPFAPFTAEDIWLKLKDGGDEDSVHLANWPVSGSRLDEKVLTAMTLVRRIVSAGLEARQQKNIRVRQPLGRLSVKNCALQEKYLAIIQDELNVKKVEIFKGAGEIVTELDTEVTAQLKQEGDYRELVRALQDLRKSLALTPRDFVPLVFDTDAVGKSLVQKFEKDLKKTVLSSSIKFGTNDGFKITVGDLFFRVKIVKK